MSATSPATPGRDAIVVLCSCPDETTAERIGRALVSEGLAACVTLAAVRSLYRWQGSVQDEPEVLLVIKASGTAYQEIEMRLTALHPYEVPEILALPVSAGSEAYLAWIASAGPAAPRA